VFILVRPQFPRKVNFNVSLYMDKLRQSITSYLVLKFATFTLEDMQVLQMEMSTNHLSLSNSTNMAAMLNMLLLHTTTENALLSKRQTQQQYSENLVNKLNQDTMP
jgi:hypothetical protein